MHEEMDDADKTGGDQEYRGVTATQSHAELYAALNCQAACKQFPMSGDCQHVVRRLHGPQLPLICHQRSFRGDGGHNPLPRATPANLWQFRRLLL